MQDKHARLVPQLRFPEFHSSQDWQNTKLEDIAIFLKGKFLPKSALSVDGDYPCIHYGELITMYSEVITAITSRTDQNENVLLSNKNDVLMPTSGETPDILAKACSIKLDNVILGGDILVIRTDKQEICGEFLSRYIRHMEQKVLQYVTGTTVYHLYANSLKMLPLHLPKLEEQKKISDCLGALDDLFSAENSKLEALRKHKRGLMQQLFPQSGENVPRLRFPEFQDCDEWISKMLYEIAEIVKGKQLNNLNIIPGKFPVWNGGISPSGFHNEWNAEGGTITISEGGNSCGFVNHCHQRFWLGGHCYALINLLINQNFLFQLLKHKEVEIMNLRVGSGLPNIQRSDLQQHPLLIPPTFSEQKKIADCLGSLDCIIESTGQKLEALRQHKKGLLQQLFPPLRNQ